MGNGFSSCFYSKTLVLSFLGSGLGVAFTSSFFSNILVFNPTFLGSVCLSVGLGVAV